MLNRPPVIISLVTYKDVENSTISLRLAYLLFLLVKKRGQRKTLRS